MNALAIAILALAAHGAALNASKPAKPAPALVTCFRHELAQGGSPTAPTVLVCEKGGAK